jgi:hypothetical protein
MSIPHSLVRSQRPTPRIHSEIHGASRHEAMEISLRFLRFWASIFRNQQCCVKLAEIESSPRRAEFPKIPPGFETEGL